MKYGLELTRNSKVGWAFSLARKHSCIAKTDVCSRLCYGNGMRYGSVAQRSKRLRNYETCLLLLEVGGPQLLAENLLLLIDQARPIDWLAAKFTGMETSLPWSLRLHDIGDFFSVDYVKAWQIAMEKRPECAFWFYTRSFVDRDFLTALTQLAALTNCQGWLSADAENYLEALRAYSFAPDVWKVSLLQEDLKVMNTDAIEALRSEVSEGKLVNFPYHRSGRHVAPAEGLFTCPQVLGVFALQTANDLLKPCQQCGFCLP